MYNVALARMDNSRSNKSERTLSNRKKSQSARSKKRPQTKTKRPAATTPQPSKKSTPNWGKLLSPKNMEESMTTISTLRGFCKQCMRYFQQADNLLDTLYVTSNSLQESGLLKKISESKGKNLNSGDFTTLLIALMNSPLGNSFFKRMTGSGSDESSTAPEPAKQAPSTPAPAALPPANAQAPSTQTNQTLTPPTGSHAPQQGPPRYPGTPQNPYGYPPGSMPM